MVVDLNDPQQQSLRRILRKLLTEESAATGQSFFRMDTGGWVDLRAVAVALRASSGTGFVVVRNVSDSGAGVATLPISGGRLAKYSSPLLSLPQTEKIYEIVVDRGSAQAVGIAYVGFEIDRTY